MASNIESTLTSLFDQYRIIFWYDAKAELRERYEAVVISGVHKLEVNRNEFYIKHLLSREKPEEKFLLYLPFSKPEHKDNWLLDLELAGYEFRTNEEAVFLQELGLLYDYKELVSQHLEFFRSKERRQKLKTLLVAEDSFREIRQKMLAVVFNTPGIGLHSFLQAHANAFMEEDDRLEKALERFALKSFYWSEIEAVFNYHSSKPGIYDFLLQVFSTVFSLGKKAGLSKDAVLLISVWKDSKSYQEAFKQLSRRIATDLKIESALNDAPLDEVAHDDIFIDIDYKVIIDLINGLVDERISYERLNKIIKARENKYWYEEFRGFYACLEHAGEMLRTVRDYKDVQFESFEDGVKLYSNKLYKVDYHYRKFIYNYHQKSQDKVLSSLYQKVEKVYSNDWLMPLTDRWQLMIDSLSTWPRPLGKTQTNFFKDHVQSVLGKGQRLFVVVSDALRYECGYEFFDLVNRRNRYEGEIDFMITSLPSYTQLGMAALLPHKNLTIQAGSDQVLADGIPSQGIQGRVKVLENYKDKRAIAIQATDFMKMNSSTAGRDYVKQYDLIYIYHNRIDKAGDDKVSEDKVFEAAEAEMDYLMDILKRIANMNGTNMIITADHGFIYQDSPLEESDFVKAEVEGHVWKENRRFFIGEGLKSDHKMKHFKAADLHLEGDYDVLIPKSINRHRVKGAGSRYVHGGASLQEIMVPLLKITKKKKDTVDKVEIDVIKHNNKITTNILTVSFLQIDSADESLLPRTIRASILAMDGEQLSDQFTYTFDSSHNSERLREVKYQFQMSSRASAQYKNKTVKLLLEEQIEGSSQWIAYKEYPYQINISISSDFDDFN